MRSRAGIIVVLLALSASIAAAQINTGEIRCGSRQPGGVLPGAVVTATHTASGLVVERTTDAEGRFFLPALRLGAWNLDARLSGLQPQAHTIVVGRTLTVDFSLGVQGLTEQVFGNPTSGRIFSARSPREMQFGLRFAF
jgi:hypothetical protein